MEWVDCNLGSKLTMKYPSIYLLGAERPRRDPLDRVRGQGPAPGRRRQDHPRRAEDDLVDLLQVDLQGRRPGHLSRAARGRQGRHRGAAPRWSATPCCSTRTPARTPTRRSGSTRATPTSATRPRSRRSARSSSSTSRPHGLDEEEASKMIVNGFIEPITKELPMEYAVEMNRLIELQMEGVDWLTAPQRRPPRSQSPTGSPSGAGRAPGARVWARAADPEGQGLGVHRPQRLDLDAYAEAAATGRGARGAWTAPTGRRW